MLEKNAPGGTYGYEGAAQKNFRRALPRSHGSRADFGGGLLGSGDVGCRFRQGIRRIFAEIDGFRDFDGDFLGDFLCGHRLCARLLSFCGRRMRERPRGTDGAPFSVYARAFLYVDGRRFQSGQLFDGAYGLLGGACLPSDSVFYAPQAVFCIRRLDSDRLRVDFLCHLLYFFTHVFSFISEKY